MPFSPEVFRFIQAAQQARKASEDLPRS
jgi:hypothetical protein